MVWLEHDALFDWLDEHPRVAVDMLQVLAHRMRSNNERICDLVFMDVPGRLAKTLLNLASRFGEPVEAGLKVPHDLTQEEMRAYRGSLTEPGKPSPYRDRSVEENLQLFQDMRDGKFADGSKTLRAKIDMASPNMNLRDPAIYRIVRAHHHRQGDKWCIYPLYDFAHPIQDALEGITHSMCSIEFENHRPLYEWVVDNCPLPHHPKQREFARLNVTHTVMSKRYLRQLVFEKHVEGWDDPRMPTLCALRRRGYTPSAILDFVQRAGIAKANSLVDIKIGRASCRERV